MSYLLLYIPWRKNHLIDITSYKDKVVIITGASRGIGEEIAYQYAKKGAILILSARNISLLSSVADKCKSLGSPRAHVVALDAGNKESCENLIRTAIKLEQTIHVVVLNHCISTFQRLFDIKNPSDQSQLFQQMMDVNYMGYVRIALASLPHLQSTAQSDATPTSLIIVSSLAGYVPTPYVHAYSASKHAINGFAGALQHELALERSLSGDSNMNRVHVTLAILGAIGTQTFYESTVKEIQGLAVPQDLTAKKIVEAGALNETIVYFPGFIYYMRVLHAAWDALAFKVIRKSHGLKW